MSDTPLLAVYELSRHFPLRGGLLSRPRAWVRAVDGVTFTVDEGESFGLVGESGCGKTTLGRLVLRLIDASGGRIVFHGRDITHFNRMEMRPVRQELQAIFQDPYSSLDPRMKVESIVTEPFGAIERISKAERRELAAELLDRVGLRAGDLKKYPHEFSGGQRQRIGIARALCVRPRLIVADEPVSALDVSVQAQVINLMEDLKEVYHLSYIFISHDLSIVEHVCDRIAVMYLGKIVELATAEIFAAAPRHPYTSALLASVPLPDPHRRTKPFAVEGEVPDPFNPPSGCAFHPRCPFVFDRCRIERPSLLEVTRGHSVACWLKGGRGLEGESLHRRRSAQRG